MDTKSETLQDTAEEQQAVGMIYSHVFAMMKNGNTYYEIVQSLEAKGLSNETATIVANNANELYSKAVKSQANKDMLYGALWCIGGTIVTAITYSAASEGGGSYVVAWGAIIFGLVQFIKGAINSNK
jgi:hypothetical protein